MNADFIFKILVGIVKNLTGIVAVYGAGLSTYIFIYQRAERQKRVRVTLSSVFLTRRENLSDPKLLLKAANIGHRAVRMAGCCIRLPGGENIPSVSMQMVEGEGFPCDLLDGGSCSLAISIGEVVSALREKGWKKSVRLRAEFWDTTDARFLSKKVTLPIEEDLNRSTTV